MSSGFVGTIGSIATGQLQQMRGAEAERATQEVSNQTRRAESNQLAENAAGVGKMDQEGETSERDADGRRLWERPQRQATSEKTSEPKPSEDAPVSRDPSGQSGQQLDLSG